MENKNLEKRKELIQQINANEKLFQKRKTKRALYLLIFYTIVFMVVMYWIDGQQTIFDFEWLLGAFLVSIFLAGISFVANALIFKQLFDISNSEEKNLAYLRQKLSELENEV